MTPQIETNHMAKKSVVIAAVLVLAASLAACATPTPYQPAIPGKTSDGYSERQIEPNRWQVMFTGNSYTSRDTVEGYLLYRAAQLTLQQGYDWFEMVDRHTEKNQQTYVDPMYSPWYGPGFGYWRPYWRYYGAGYGWRTWDPFWGDPFWAGSINVQTVKQYQAAAEIVMGHGAKPANDPRAYDARAVMVNLAPHIKYPEAKK